MTDWKKMDEPGIYEHPAIEGKFHIRATATDPETGKVVERRATITESKLLDAKTHRSEMKAEIRRPASDQQGPPLFVDFAADWINERVAEGRWAKSTEAKNGRAIRDHVAPPLADLYVDEIDQSAIRNWIAETEAKQREIDGKTKPYAHSTLRTWWGLLKDLVKALYHGGFCDLRFYHWVCDRTGPKSNVSGRRERRTLTKSQLREYVTKAEEIAPKRYPEIITLACIGNARKRAVRPGASTRQLPRRGDPH